MYSVRNLKLLSVVQCDLHISRLITVSSQSTWATARLFCVRKGSHSNLRRCSDYPKNFCGFRQMLGVNSRTMERNRQRQFPLTFQLHQPIIMSFWRYIHFIFHYANGAIKQVRNTRNIKSNKRQNSKWWTRNYNVRTPALRDRIQGVTYNSVFTYCHGQSCSSFPQTTNFFQTSYCDIAFIILLLLIQHNLMRLRIFEHHSKAMRTEENVLQMSNTIVIKYPPYFTTAVPSGRAV